MPIPAISSGLSMNGMGATGSPQSGSASIEALEQKLQRLSEEKQKALENGDEKKAQRLEKQMQALKKQLEQLRLREKRRQQAGRMPDEQNTSGQAAALRLRKGLSEGR